MAPPAAAFSSADGPAARAAALSAFRVSARTPSVDGVVNAVTTLLQRAPHLECLHAHARAAPSVLHVALTSWASTAHIHPRICLSHPARQSARAATQPSNLPEPAPAPTPDRRRRAAPRACWWRPTR